MSECSTTLYYIIRTAGLSAHVIFTAKSFRKER
jgi:hypothetical protein